MWLDCGWWLTEEKQLKPRLLFWFLTCTCFWLLSDNLLLKTPESCSLFSNLVPRHLFPVSTRCLSAVLCIAAALRCPKSPVISGEPFTWKHTHLEQFARPVHKLDRHHLESALSWNIIVSFSLFLFKKQRNNKGFCSLTAMFHYWDLHEFFID